MEWKDVFTPPFKETCGMVFDKKDRFCMNTLTHDDEVIAALLAKLNGEIKVRIENADFHYDEKEGKICFGKHPLLWIRAWGRLTGCGGLKLDSEVAAKLQDDFADWMVNTLND